MFRVVKESETVDARQHCFLLQSAGHDPRYLSVETRQELLRIENSWNAAIVTSVIKLGVSIDVVYSFVCDVSFIQTRNGSILIRHNILMFY